MKNMGIQRLTLVSPEKFPNAEATERASGADDLLANAVVTKTLEEAIADCQWVFGTSARSRTFPWPQMTPLQGTLQMIPYLQANQEVAIVFGTERSGLSNEQLQLCDFHLTIPTHPGYSSLNLSQAVQVICYEIYQQILPHIENKLRINETAFDDKASHGEINGLVQHFEETALKLNFMDARHPKKLMPRFKRLLTKAQLEKEEVNILRGFLKAVQYQLERPKSEVPESTLSKLD
jgi:tRNA (cytidine32/uridine32-2'-O)-methyltransferase